MAINLTRPQPNIVMPDGAWVGRSANGPKVEFDDTNNYLEITGCDVSVGGTGPGAKLQVSGGGIYVDGVTNFSGTGYGLYVEYPVLLKDGATIGSGDAADTLKVNTSGNSYFTGGGNVGAGTMNPSNPIHGVTNPATTNTIVDVLRLDRTTSGTAADGIGCGVVLYAEDASGNIEEAANIDAVFTTAAHATQVGEMRLGVMGTDIVAIDSKKNVVLAPAAIATDATDGFTYIPTCAGAPTGVPTAKTGTVAMVFDTSNNKLYVYDGGWLNVTLAA